VNVRRIAESLSAGRARVGDPPRDFALRELAWAAFRALGGSDVAEKIGIITRGYGGRLSETLGFLPGRGDHSPAMIAAAAWSRSASRTLNYRRGPDIRVTADHSGKTVRIDASSDRDAAGPSRYLS
jgi:hypothetical protein